MSDRQKCEYCDKEAKRFMNFSGGSYLDYKNKELEEKELAKLYLCRRHYNGFLNSISYFE